jgi:predicted acyl esterase
MKSSRIIPFLWLIFLFAIPGGVSQAAGREYEQADQGVDASKLLAALAEGTVHQHVMMPMRDSVKLATEVFIPPGNDPWPAVLVRTPSGRLQPTGYAATYKSGDVVFITPDPRGTGDSEGTIDPVSSDNEIRTAAETSGTDVARRHGCMLCSAFSNR